MRVDRAIEPFSGPLRDLCDLCVKIPGISFHTEAKEHKETAIQVHAKDAEDAEEGNAQGLGELIVER